MALSNTSGRNSQHQMASNATSGIQGDTKSSVTVFDSDMTNEKGKKKTVCYKVTSHLHLL